MGMSGCFAAVDQKKLGELRADPEQIEAFLFPEEGDAPEHYAEVDKAWHAIHFMLTGDAWKGEAPLAWAVMGGEEFGDEIGYGCARFLLPQQVAEIAAALQALGVENFKARYRPDAMDAADIYPTIWVRDGALGLEYVVPFYVELVDFYATAAARGDGVILWLM